MTPTTDWRDGFDKNFPGKQLDIEISAITWANGSRASFSLREQIKSFISQTIEAEKAKAVAEALSAKVNRLEIIDHTAKGPGRAYVKWEEGDFTITPDLQDNNRTLKIFLDDAE